MPAVPGDDAGTGRQLRFDTDRIPAPDLAAEPAAFVVAADDGTRLHFLDWSAGGPAPEPPADPVPRVLLVPGFGRSAWSWTPVARRLRHLARIVVPDLRGHGLSDAPIDGYSVASLAADVLAVAEGAGLLEPSRPAADDEHIRDPAAPARLVLAGHGFGADVAAAAAARLARRCDGLVLVDGGWETMAERTDLDPEAFIASIEEPPEVMRSMRAFLADRASFDPGTWDRDQERAARETVVELPSRRLVPAIHPHVRDAMVRSMYDAVPLETLVAVTAPVVALTAVEGEASAGHLATLERVSRELVGLERPPIASAILDGGHDLLRHRPTEVAAAILGLIEMAHRS